MKFSSAGKSQANYSVGVLAENSQISINDSRFVLKSRYGTIGIKSRESSTSVTTSYFQGTRTLEFLYLVNQEGGRGRFDTNILEGGQSNDAVGVFLTRTEGGWYNNTLVAGTGTNTTQGFHIRGSKGVRIVNNIITK